MAQSASAQSNTPEPPASGPALNWVRARGADSCADPISLAHRIEERLQRQVFARPRDAAMVIEGRVSHSSDGTYQAHIRIAGQAGQVYGVRELRVPDTQGCESLDEMVVLVLAITLRGRGGLQGIPLPTDVMANLDALFAGEPSELDPQDLPAAAGQPQEKRTSVHPRIAERHLDPDRDDDGDTPPPRPPQHLPGFAVGGGVTVMSGLQPGGGMGPAAHVRLSLEGASFVLEGGMGLPQNVEVNFSRGRVRYEPFQTALSACLPEHYALFSFLTLCGHVGLNVLHVRATNFAVQNARRTKYWLQLGPTVRARTAIVGPLYLTMAVRLSIRIAPPTVMYILEDGEAIEQLRGDPGGIEGLMGLELVLW